MSHLILRRRLLRTREFILLGFTLKGEKPYISFTF